MIVYSEEKFRDHVKELTDLAREQWEEAPFFHKERPLDINTDAYIKLEEAGILKMLTVRDDGKLIGYASLIIGPHMHYNSTIMSVVDAIFLRPEYRRSIVSARLLLNVEEVSRKYGATILSLASKMSHDIGDKLMKNGYVHTESLYEKEL